MSIKSDKWIRRMAEQQKMIEPFEAGQVRNVDGHKIVGVTDLPELIARHSGLRADHPAVSAQTVISGRRSGATSER